MKTTRLLTRALSPRRFPIFLTAALTVVLVLGTAAAQAADPLTT